MFIIFDKITSMIEISAIYTRKGDNIMENFKALYTPAEVAKIVFSNQVAPGSVRVKTQDGSIPCTRFGRKIFIPGKWVKEQLEYGFGSAEAAEAALIARR